MTNYKCITNEILLKKIKHYYKIINQTKTEHKIEDIIHSNTHYC